jgi:ribulose-phosphate 3-epimerase
VIIVSSAFKIAASILAADFTRLGEQVHEAEEAGVDLFHLDIMDGLFVPNISFGPMVVEAVRGITRKTLDVHLMIEKPERYIDVFAQAGANMINVHAETCPHLHRTVQYVQEHGVKVGVALNPHTPFSMIREIVPIVDRVLIMTVNPGFGGQTLIPSTVLKLKQIAESVKQLDHPPEIAVDGGIDITTMSTVVGHGANVIIAGTSIFHAEGGIAAGVAGLRAAGKAVDLSALR